MKPNLLYRALGKAGILLESAACEVVDRVKLRKALKLLGAIQFRYHDGYSSWVLSSVFYMNIEKIDDQLADSRTCMPVCRSEIFRRSSALLKR